MNHALISPYIRTAMHSTLVESCIIKTRVLYDYELIYVRSGRCRITVDDTPHLCKKNDAVLLRPGVPHSFACPPGSPISYVIAGSVNLSPLLRVRGAGSSPSMSG